MLPQDPQSVSVLREVSQPLDERPSQFENPVLHPVSVQVPVAQLPVPLVKPQVFPQAPQWALLLRRTSQPFSGRPSQSPQPELQLRIRQLPVLQLLLALGRLQRLPQAAQFVLVLSEVSQPSLSTELQSP